MQNNYFDSTHPLRPYTYSLAATPGTITPDNALRGETPTAKPGFWPGEHNGKWIDIEDHRDEEGYMNGESFTVSDFGPYPEGWSATPPPVPLPEALDSARAAILARRRQAEYGGFLFGGQRWDSEEKDELRLNSMITMMDKTGIAEFPGWKINTDTFTTLTPELAVQAAAGLMSHYAACFQVEAAKNEQLSALIASLGDEASADDVQSWLDENLDAGWPAGEG